MQEPEVKQPTPIDIYEDSNIQMPMDVRTNINTDIYTLLMQMRAKMGDVRERFDYVPTFTWRTIPLKEDNSNIIYVITFEGLEGLTLAAHVNQEVNGLDIGLVPSKNDSIEVLPNGTVMFHNRLKESLHLDRKDLRVHVDLVIELLMNRGDEKATIIYLHKYEAHKWDGFYHLHDSILESFEKQDLTRTSIMSTKLGGEFFFTDRPLFNTTASHCRFFRVTPFKGAATYLITTNEVSKIIHVYKFDTASEIIPHVTFLACGVDKLVGIRPNWIIDSRPGTYLQALSNVIPELQEKIFEVGMKYLNVIDI